MDNENNNQDGFNDESVEIKSTNDKNNNLRNAGVVVFLLLLCGGVYYVNTQKGADVSPVASEQKVEHVAFSSDTVGDSVAVVAPAADSVNDSASSVVADAAELETETVGKADVSAAAPSAVDPLWNAEFVSYMGAKYPDYSLATNGLKEEVTIKSGMFLTNVALQHYGDKAFWIYLYLYNTDRIKNPNNVNVGTKIRIPQLDLSLVDVANAKTVAVAKQVRKDFVK